LALRALGRRHLPPTFDGPTPVTIDLPGARLRPAGGRAAPTQRVLLFSGQTRTARLYHRRVHNLPAHREITAIVQQSVEPLKQPGQRAAPGQLLAKQPNCLGIRHRVVQRQASKAHERQPVAQLILGLIIG